MSRKTALFFVIVLLLAVTGNWARATDRTGLERQIESLKGLTLPEDEAGRKALGEKLQTVWNSIDKQAVEAVPILIQSLRAELESPDPDDYFLTDVGYYLASRKETGAVDCSWAALEKVDPENAMVQAFPRLLFSWALNLSSTQDPRILPILDRLFLARQYSLFIPEHALQLPPPLVCVLLYGVFGKEAEPHLLRTLEARPETRERIMTLLGWIGSERSTEAAKHIVASGACGEQVLWAADVLIRFAGPAGRDFLQKASAEKCDEEIRKQWKQYHKILNGRSFDAIMKELKPIEAGEETVPENVLKERLSLMYENYGKDDETNPLALLRSTLPARFLVDQLIGIRSRMLHRVSDEALHDVQTTNRLIEALMYRKDYAQPTAQ
ncbi:MAG: hypothetical protein EHM61_10410 [Acidobacteria bacterium]|nr:MAG: hypothetical protein EHM61_10410 [Acidobacteriota bacterium]